MSRLGRRPRAVVLWGTLSSTDSTKRLAFFWSHTPGLESGWRTSLPFSPVPAMQGPHVGVGGPGLERFGSIARAPDLRRRCRRLRTPDQHHRAQRRSLRRPQSSSLCRKASWCLFESTACERITARWPAAPKELSAACPGDWNTKGCCRYRGIRREVKGALLRTRGDWRRAGDTSPRDPLRIHPRDPSRGSLAAGSENLPGYACKPKCCLQVLSHLYNVVRRWRSLVFDLPVLM